MISTTQKLGRDNLARTFDVARGPDGFDRYLVNRGMYISADNVSPQMVTMYEVKDNDTYTKISFAFYGTIDLWWLVCKVNGIVNPFDTLNTGTVLRVLKREYVNGIVYPAMDATEASYAGSTVNSTK